MFYELPMYIILIPSALLCLLPMKNQLRYSIRKTLLILFLVLLMTVPLHLYLHSYFNIRSGSLLPVFLTIFFIAYHKCLKVDISRSLSVFLSVAALMSILSNYATCYDAWLHPTLTPEIYTPDFVLVQCALGFLILLLFGWPIRHYGSLIIDRLRIHSIWLMTLPFMAVLLMTSMFIKPQKYETFHVNRVSIVAPMVISALLFMWIMLNVTFYFIVTGILDSAAISERAKILEIQENQFLAQQKYMESSARARHDFRQTIRTLQELARTKDMEAVTDFISAYAKTLPENESIRYCSNYALNALLNYYRQMARQNEIRLDIEMDLPDILRMSDVDLCTMLGNMLDNAVAACQSIQTGNRFIELRGQNRFGKQFILVMTNTCPKKLRKKDGAYLSTRKDGAGLGLNSVRQIVEEYSGTATFSDEDGIFYSNVLIPLR